MNKHETLISFLTAENIRFIIKPDMSEFVSYRTGGIGELIIFPPTEEALISLLDELKKNKTAFIILGGGSNTLFIGKEFSGIIISMMDLTDIMAAGNRITVSAGVLSTVISETAYENSLKGAEFLYYLPGTIGGAVFMNGGAYGGRAADLASHQGNVCCSVHTDKHNRYSSP